MVESAAAASSSSAASNDNKRPLNKVGLLDLTSRESKELVIGFSGAIGSGMEYVTEVIRTVLMEQGYRVVHIKLSRFIDFMLNNSLIAQWTDELRPTNRLEKLQVAGNLLRNQHSADFLSEIAVAYMLTDRNQPTSVGQGKSQSLDAIVPQRTAYLVDQLKNPSEVALLRRVYGNLFYLIGVLTGEKQRLRNLNKILSPQEVTSAIERDRHDEDEHGQQLDKTLKLADFFVRNNYQNTDALKVPLRRFLALIHGQTSRTPTRDEYAMYVAYSAGLRSACLSRQVGASITNSDGNVVSTGCNDVPKAKGGLYSEDDGAGDHRCIHMEGGKCFNDSRKEELGEEIEEHLNEAFKSPVLLKFLADQIRATTKGLGGEIETLLRDGLKKSGLSKSLTNQIRTKTRLRDLLEFSRSVHAEMDAIVSVARRGGPSVVGGSLYTTTFPCHNCARHIVAAGILKVFYIEPYEKSLALDLHADAIVSDSEEQDGSKVQFMHFEGVAPRQYQELFAMKGERKRAGKAVPVSLVAAPKIRVQYLDGYLDLETKIVANLVEQGLTKEQIADLTSPSLATK